MTANTAGEPGLHGAERAERAELDQEIRELHRLLPAERVPAEHRFEFLTELGMLLSRRYALDGVEADRDAAIEALCLASDEPHPPEAEPAWIRLELARLLVDRGERGRSVGDINAAVEYGRSGLAELAPAAGQADLDFAAAFCDLGIAHFLRSQYVPAGARADLDRAAEAFQDSITRLPAAHPALGWVTARAGVVLAAAAHHDVMALDERGSGGGREWRALGERVTTALETLDAGLRDMPTGDLYRTAVRYWRAVTSAIRFIYFGSGDGDRETALTDLEAILETPECDDTMRNVCHAFLAILHLYRSAPEAFRKAGSAPSLRSFAGVLAAGSVFDPESARVALDHVNQVSAAGAAAPEVAGLLSLLRAMAALGTDGFEPDDESLGDIAAGVGEAAAAQPADGDLRIAHDFLRSVRAVRRGRPEDLGAAADLLDRLSEQLGDRHPLRRMLQGTLGQILELAPDALPNSRPASPEEREAALELLEHVLSELSDDDPDRASTLNRLGAMLARSIEHEYSPDRLERVRGLLIEAVERPAADQTNEALDHFLLALIDGVRSLFGDGDARQLEDAVQRLTRAIALFPPEHQLRRLGPALLVALLAQRYSRGGGLEHLDAASYYARAVPKAVAAGDLPPGRSHTALEWLRAVIPLLRGGGIMDADRLVEAVDALRALAARLPEDDPMRPRIVGDAHTFETLREFLVHDDPDRRGLQADPGRIAAAVGSVAAAARTLPQDSPYYPADMGGAGFVKVGHGFFSRDLRIVDEGLAMLADAYGAAEAATVRPLRSWLLGSLGMALLMRYELSRDRRDLNNAIDQMEESLRAGETDPFGNMMATTLLSLSGAYHLRGDASRHDKRRSADVGLAALRARAWGVMLQTSTERAFDAAVAAAGEASEVAQRSVAGGLTGIAIEALEWGRAMVLHTATTDTGLPGLLRAGGHDDLAAEWERAQDDTTSAPWDLPDRPAGSAGQGGYGGYGGPVGDSWAPPLPSDLRERVMTAIAGTEAERRLFHPATPVEIAAALRETGARALVYLVPHDEGRGGLALVVGADGQVRRVSLPRLATGPRSRVEEFIRAQREREEADPATREGRRTGRRWAYVLGDLCDWAWTVAMEPVLEAVTDVPGRPVRTILVPVGELGAVPWHAARRLVAGGVRRYACQDAVISYAASARQFIDAGRHGHRPWRSAAALVRVGGSGLYWASKEIEQIHRRHYPDGALLGGRRRRTGAAGPALATAGNVQDLLPGPRTAGASVVHLGCHARQAQRPVDSHLLLAGGEVLGMTDILRRAQARPPGVPGGLVVLAACGSDLTARHHDEVLTLATAFMAAGAVGVVGARWPVDDLPTALFMTMFHHYLNSGYDDPAVALRAAQLWMLNPRRSVFGDLRADLADLLDAASFDEPESWAAFTYQGR